MSRAFLAFLCIMGCTTPRELPPDAISEPVKIADLPGFCEGAVIDRSGMLYVSHMAGGTVYSVAPDGKVTAWARELGEPNGHKILADGTHLVCDGAKHAVLHLAADGSLLGTAAARSDGKPLQAPNDLTLDGHGGFYFTDPGSSWVEDPTGTVHYVDSLGTVRTVLEGLAYPNGLVLRPDGKTMLLGESGTNRILSLRIVSPGRLDDNRTFAVLPAPEGQGAEGLPDGMCLDDAGNLYVAHFGMGRIEVLDTDGKIIRRYQAGNLTASNVVFGGPNRDQLYITGALGEQSSPGAVFRLDLSEK